MRRGNSGRTVSTLRLNLPSSWLSGNFRGMNIPVKCLFVSVLTVKAEPIVHFGSANFIFRPYRWIKVILNPYLMRRQRGRISLEYLKNG